MMKIFCVSKLFAPILRQHWVLVLAICVACFGNLERALAAKAGAVPLPELGESNPHNRWEAALELVYFNNFESADTLFTLGTYGATYTTAANQVIRGTRSIRIATNGYCEIPAGEITFLPGETYTIEFEYTVDDASASGGVPVVGIQWTGFDAGANNAISAPAAGLHAVPDVFRHNMRLPNAANDYRPFIFAFGGAGTIDEIRVYRHVPKVFPTKPNLLNFGFPRLCSYHVYSTFSGSQIYDVPVNEVRDALARYDLVTGIEVDHTLGNRLDYLPLRERNPNILLLPYQQTFVSVSPDNTVAAANSAGLYALFNGGLPDEWFAENASGARLPEVLYPVNFQMNHTSFCPLVGGETFVDYARRFVRRTVLPTGYWAGIQFDQSEWYPNPLLANGDPFQNSDFVLVNTDYDNNGVADTSAQQHTWSAAAFASQFAAFSKELGNYPMIFGNPGENTYNEQVLRYVNGFQNEVWVPYRRLPNETFDTDDPSFWYRSRDIQNKARKHLRAPQINCTQMSGIGLGTPSGTTSTNGLADRVPEMTLQDARRLRLGLATILLDDGFFGYDFVDNASAPLAWGDEFGVDLTSGASSTALAHRHYLGQPLGDAVELDYPKLLLYEETFTTWPPVPPAGVFLGPALQHTTTSGEVITGSGSARLSYDSNPGTQDDYALIVYTDPDSFGLENNKVYQFEFDYRVTAYSPENFGSLINGGLVDFAQTARLDRYGSAYLSSRDAHVGLTGKFRTATRTRSTRYSAFATLADTGTIVIDNLKIYEGTGGVFRRDFENGVVLVNPTPVSQTVPLASLVGPRNRSGLKRIAGTLDSAWNHGGSVLTDLVLPAGDAIILLANPQTAAAPTAVAAPLATAQTGQVSLTWNAASGTVAGYVINYGLVGGTATLYQTIGRREDCVIANLAAGRNYQFRVAAYDYLGNQAAYSPFVSATVSGSTSGQVPVLTSSTLNLVLGANATLTGTSLASGSANFTSANAPLEYNGSSVKINGIACRILTISATSITFITPTNLGGSSATLRVDRNTNSSVTIACTITSGLVAAVPKALGFTLDANRTARGVWQVASGNWVQLWRSSDLLNWDPVGTERRALTDWFEGSYSFGSADKGFLKLTTRPGDSP